MTTKGVEMSLTPEAEQRIDDRIKRLAGRNASRASRDELRQHVADAAEDLAEGRAVSAAEVDAAFTGLGSDAEIRATFFPARQRLAIDRLGMGLLVGAALLAAIVVASEDSGTASCSLDGPGSCSATTSGHAADVMLWAAPPLIVMACLAWLPVWTGLVAAGLYSAVTLLRALDGPNGGFLAASAFVGAGGLCLFAAIRHWRQARGLAHA